MKHKHLAGMLTVGALALAPVFGQSTQGQGSKSQGSQSQGSQSQGSQSQGSQSQGSQGKGASGQSGAPATQDAPRASEKTGSASRLGSDSAFIMKAARSGMAEVKHGQLGAEKATNDDVKAFAQKMVDDHTKANDELKQLATSKGVTVPADVDAKHQAAHNRLSKLSGAEFDRAFMQQMVADHREAVNEFRRESKSGSDSEVKAWAAQTLPTLEGHLQQAESIHGKVKK